MLIDKEVLRCLIPHTGNMCLLDHVMTWVPDEIVCIAISHTEPNNPLRRNNHLSSIHLLEYGAQAMAVHGGLLARETGKAHRPGYLAALRNVDLEQRFIDTIASPLTVHAQKLASFTDSFMYQFTITSEDVFLASARATVIVQKDSTP